jgi:hypothetical protein
MNQAILRASSFRNAGALSGDKTAILLVLFIVVASLYFA